MWTLRLARVLATFGHKSLFSLDILPVKMDVSTSRVVAIFGHKSLFSLDFTSKKGRFYVALRPLCVVVATRENAQATQANPAYPHRQVL